MITEFVLWALRKAGWEPNCYCCRACNCSYCELPCCAGGTHCLMAWTAPGELDRWEDERDAMAPALPPPPPLSAPGIQFSEQIRL